MTIQMFKMIKIKFLLKINQVIIEIIMNNASIVQSEKNIKIFLFTHPILLFILMSIPSFIFLVSFIIFICKPDLMKSAPQNYIVLILIQICETILLCNISILYSFIYVLGAISFVIAIYIAIF